MDKWRQLSAVLLTGAILSLLGGGAVAQSGSNAPQTAPSSQVLIVDFDRAFRQSMFGQRIVREFNAAALALNAENERLLAELNAEEASLTERRSSMTAEEFSAAADAFDAKTQLIRQEQDEKQRLINSVQTSAEAAFTNAAQPVLIQVMESRGGNILLDSRAVTLFSLSIDVTDAAVAQIDAAIGEGLEIYTIPQIVSVQENEPN